MVAKSLRDFGWVVCPGRYTHALTFSLSITTSQFGTMRILDTEAEGRTWPRNVFGSLTGYRLMEESQGFEGSCSAVFRRDSCNNGGHSPREMRLRSALCHPCSYCDLGFGQSVAPKAQIEDSNSRGSNV